MCGRYAIATSRLPRIENALGITLPPLAPRYNVAPTQIVPIVRAAGQGGYELVEARWGLIPAWSKEPRTAYATFNARAETVATKPAFRAAYRGRRCLVPASGFYEWREEGGRRQPWYFSAADGQELAFAGLWEEWHGPDAPPLLSCTIIVGTANDFVAPIHDRMAVILGAQDYARWLDPAQPPGFIDTLLRPCPSRELRGWRVSRAVSNAQAEGTDLIAPVDAGDAPPGSSPRT
jgi:putative SOS response-associated peptidase YedK